MQDKPTVTEASLHGEATVSISPSIKKIQEADVASSSWFQRDFERQKSLAEAKSQGKDTKDLIKPEAKDDKVKLGESINNSRKNVSNTCDSAFIDATDKTKAHLTSLKTELLNARKPGEELDPVTLAKAITFAEENAGARRSWENVADILQKYPEALQWDSLRSKILNSFKFEVNSQGPLELARPAEQRILDLLIQNEGLLNEADRKEILGWGNYVEGHRLFGQVETATKIKQNTLDANDVSRIPGVNFEAGRIQTAIEELKLPYITSDNFGQVVAMFSRNEGISDGERDERRMIALGYSAAILAARPYPYETNQQKYSRMSVSVAKTLTILAGPDESVYDLRKGSDQFSLEFGKVWDSIRFRDADAVFQEQNLVVVNKRSEKDEEKNKELRDQEETRQAEERKKIEDEQKIDTQRRAANLLTENIWIKTYLDTLTNPTSSPADRQKATEGLKVLAKDPNTKNFERLAAEMALQITDVTTQLRTDYSTTGAQQQMLAAVK